MKQIMFDHGLHKNAYLHNEAAFLAHGFQKRGLALGIGFLALNSGNNDITRAQGNHHGFT